MIYSGVPRFKIPARATAELRGLVHGWGDTPLIPGDIATVTWVVYELNLARKTLTEVEGYAEAAITPADCISETLLQGRSILYNFHHVPPNRTTPPYLEIGKIYRVHYTLTPNNAAEQLLIVPFEIEVI